MRYAFVFAVILVLICLPVLADNEPCLADQIVKSTIVPENEPSQPFNQHLQFLADVRGDHQAEVRFYMACLDEISTVSSKDSLPALEALLNSRQSLDSVLNPTRQIMLPLRRKATEIWYDIRWQGAEVSTRIETALYGCHPSPPVHVDNIESRHRLLVLGDEARLAFLAMLGNPNLQFKRELWSVLAAESAVKILSHSDSDPWHLTDHDIDTIINSNSDYGTIVLIGYLLRQSDYRVGAPLLTWLGQHSDDPWKLNRVVRDMRYFDWAQDSGLRPKITESLIKIAQAAQMHVFTSHAELPDSDWAALIYLIHQALYHFGPSDQSYKYFEQYQEDANRRVPNLREDAADWYVRSVMSSLNEATRYANKAVVEWSQFE